MSTLHLSVGRPVALVMACAVVLATVAVRSPEAVAAPPERVRPGAVVPGHYIVTLDETVDLAATTRELRGRGARIGRTYTRALHGFAGEIPLGLVRQLQRDPRIVRVEADVVARIADAGVQTAAPWGLDRIDQRSRDLDGRFTYRATGAGVRAYVIDTGVRSTHLDFGGRVTSGFDAYGDGTTEDCHGHGTHVAGIVAGATYGVAKQAQIVPVRAFRCDGTGSGSAVLSSIDWILARHPSGTPGVVNMSFVFGASRTIDAAARKLVDGGIVAVAGAGNDAADACTRSPARESSVLTVAATDSGDKRSSFSNFGSCVDIFAPGSSILSARSGSDTASRSSSGTSYASPHAAGTAAVLFGLDPKASARDISAAVLAAATPGVISDAGTGTPNLLLFADPREGGAPVAPPAANIAPTAGFGLTCSDLTCDLDASASNDPDGSVTSYQWTFGDGRSADGRIVRHTYAAAGTYEVELTVTDDAGATGTLTRTANVTSPAPSAETPKVGLTGTSHRSGSTWRATMTVVAAPSDGGKSVRYSWRSERTNGGSGSCTLGSDATCSFGSTDLRSNDPVAEFTVSSIGGVPVEDLNVTVQR
jgi:subtilisin family serine protease